MFGGAVGLPLRRRRAHTATSSGSTRSAGARDLGLLGVTSATALPGGVRPATRSPSSARSRSSRASTDKGAKHAKWFVRSAETTGWLRRARAGRRASSRRSRSPASRSSSRSTARCRRPSAARGREGGRRQAHDLVRAGRDGALGIVRASTRSAASRSRRRECAGAPGVSPASAAARRDDGSPTTRVASRRSRRRAEHLDQGAGSKVGLNRRSRRACCGAGDIHEAGRTTTSTSTPGSSPTRRRRAARPLTICNVCAQPAANWQLRTH
jgi:hypothetical protein